MYLFIVYCIFLYIYSYIYIVIKTKAMKTDTEKIELLKERIEYVISWLEDAKVHKGMVDNCKKTLGQCK